MARLSARAAIREKSHGGHTMRITLLFLLIGMLPGLPVRGQPMQKSEDVHALLSQMEAMAIQLRDYTVVGVDDHQGKQIRWKLYFKQPDLVRIDSPSGQVTVQPNGEIRGRLGHGLFGHISRRLDRNDRRLRDSSGQPFWENDYSDELRCIRSLINAGAAATLTTTLEGYDLEIRSGPTQWRYVIDPETLFFRESSRAEYGQVVSVTHYSDFRPNTGLDDKVFEF
jgi:outer membrane lipoprotein-sorting protein